MTPLEYDAKIVKEFGITDVDEIEDELKLAHVRAQLDEIKKFLWRERVELQLAEAQKSSDVEALAASAAGKVAEKRNNIKGVLASVRVLSELQNELEAKLAE